LDSSLFLFCLDAPNPARFNPGSYTSWLGLAERAWQLFLVYLDHAPAFTPREPPVATAFDRLLLRTSTDGPAPALAPFLAPFFTASDGPAGSTPPGARVREILHGMGLEAELLAPLGDSKAAQAEALKEGGAWAAVVCVAYRLLTERALRVLGPVLGGYVGVAGSSAREDKELLQKQVRQRSSCLPALGIPSHALTLDSSTTNRWRPASASPPWPSSAATISPETRTGGPCNAGSSPRRWRTRRLPR